jgi:hypothetical protein
MIEWEAERCKINYERLSKMHSKVDLCGQRVLSFTAAKQRANAIDPLVAPWPILHSWDGHPTSIIRVIRGYLWFTMMIFETYLMDGNT